MKKSGAKKSGARKNISRIAPEDDGVLWKRVADTVTPLVHDGGHDGGHNGGHAGGCAIPTPPKQDAPKKESIKKALPKKESIKKALPKEESQKKALPKEESQKKALAAERANRHPPRLAAHVLPANLDEHGWGGISRANARAIKSGQSGYSTVLDLHGLTLERAEARLQRFVEAAAAEGHRHVLIITGKGRHNRGAIRQHLPEWLSRPPLASLVIAYCQAKHRDGGDGAWYVNLRVQK